MTDAEAKITKTVIENLETAISALSTRTSRVTLAISRANKALEKLDGGSVPVATREWLAMLVQGIGSVIDQTQAIRKGVQRVREDFDAERGDATA